MISFNPDIITEVTAVCDRACSGCYAPNLLSKFSPNEMYATKPELFLKPATFQAILNSVSSKIDTISLRGGEPSRHPYLQELIKIAHQSSDSVYIETHARWILESATQSELLECCQALGTIIKISFDKMHGLSSSELRAITDKLSSIGINWAIAITELNEADFLKTRNLCDWAKSDQIIYQKKALSSDELVKPIIGVIKLNGTLAKTLTTKESMKQKDTVTEASA